MKSAIIKYLIFMAVLFSGAMVLAQTGLFTAGEALTHAITLFVIINVFLGIRLLFHWLRNAIRKQEMKNPKYQEENPEE